jgi:hypothetical protein
MIANSHDMLAETPWETPIGLGVETLFFTKESVCFDAKHALEVDTQSLIATLPVNWSCGA